MSNEKSQLEILSLAGSHHPDRTWGLSKQPRLQYQINRYLKGCQVGTIAIGSRIKGSSSVKSSQDLIADLVVLP